MKPLKLANECNLNRFLKIQILDFGDLKLVAYMHKMASEFFSIDNKPYSDCLLFCVVQTFVNNLKSYMHKLSAVFWQLAQSIR